MIGGGLYIPRASLSERIARAVVRHVYGLALAVILFACLLAFAVGVGSISLYL